MTNMTKTQISPNPTLADLRRACGLTVRQVGEVMGLTHSRIVQFESKGVPYVRQVEELARIYGVTEAEATAADRRTRLGK